MSSSYAQGLLDAIVWRDEGPRLKKNEEGAPQEEDALVAYFPGNDRLPPLWKTAKGNLRVEQDFEDTAVVNTTIAVAVERLEESLQHAAQTTVLPQLLMWASLEEGLHELATNASSNVATTTTTTGRTRASFSTEQPRYYSLPPSQYLQSPVPQQAATAVASAQAAHGYSPSMLLQRIKAGCHLAHYYLHQQQQVQQQDLLVRRSSRLPPPPPPPKPHVMQKGGRIALWWIEDYKEEKTSGDDKEEVNESNNNKEEPRAEEAGEQNGHLKTSDEEDKDDSKDKDFEPTNDTTDEALEAADDDDESSEESDDDDDESMIDEEVDLVLNNPHLKPTRELLLDWMGRRGKSLTPWHVQQAVCTLMEQEIYLPMSCLNRLDQMVVDSAAVDESSFVVLECTTGETVKQLSKMEPTEFSRCKFAFKVQTPTSQVEQEMEQERLDQQQAEQRYKEDKAWATWRHKGIQSGYTKWPDWSNAVTEWRKEQQQEQQQQQPQVVAAVAAALPEAAPTQESDLALAQSLETSTRRTTRRAGAESSDVFYGGQTSMSQKQLMDTIVRLAHQSPFLSIVQLTGIIADDSTNPLHRLRVALGRLVWKRNQLARTRVHSIWTDEPLWKRGACLVESIPQDAAAAARNVPTEDDLKRIAALIPYLQSLQQTEMQLRALILQHLTSTPIVTVATAADERMGTLEALDADDFGQDDSDIEWSTTGHDLLNQVVFRPLGYSDQGDALESMWYKINGFVPSTPLSTTEEEHTAAPAAAPSGKEPNAVERRMRFRAIPVTEDGQEIATGTPSMILTQGQVHAGVRAAKMERESNRASESSHAFACGVGSIATLESLDGGSDLQCHVVGYDTVLLKDKSENGDAGANLEHRIMLLPQSDDDSLVSEIVSAFWAVVRTDSNGELTCQSIGTSKPAKYRILQSDYDSSSQAFQECKAIVDFLRSLPQAQIFMEPVDPIALNIPTYRNVVKHPMDISTLSSNLDKDLYSKIPPGQSVGRSPVARMLNGPFKEDVLRIYDNAMLFNPPDDWIHQLAASSRKSVVKKIEQVSRAADQGGVSWERQKRSVYVDEDSDVDMYEYQSDRDDEDYDGRRKTRKRKRNVKKGEDFSTRAMEGPINLQSTLSESQGLRGPFASIPINSEAAGFSLSSEWSCRRKAAAAAADSEEDVEELKRKQEMEELLRLQREVEDIERAGLRRSSRAHAAERSNTTMSKVPEATKGVEYFLSSEGALLSIGNDEADSVLQHAASNRAEVESQREMLHEMYFAKLYQQVSKFLQPTGKTEYGVYMNSSFPPFLGRVLPSLSPDLISNDNVTWEIRSAYVIPAIRWVLRGLINSGHLTELDTGVILTNDIYYADDSLEPFDVLDVREMQRRKRANNMSEEEESEEEIELSEYEKLRAERVARNAERLKALGLA